jgi:hypothetical protein
LPIDTPEFQKLPGVICEHCTGRGCGIYETRPRPCRGFNCGWRLLAQLDDDWRPDRSGVLVTPQNDDVPPDFELRDGIEFLIVGGEDAVRRRGFAEFVALCVRRRVATFVSVAAPEGFFPPKALVNARLLEASQKNDAAAVTSLLLDLVRQAEHYKCQPAVLRHAK